MLEKLNTAEVKHIAELAKAVRTARDDALRISREDLGEPRPTRGEHDPAESLGFEPLPPDHPGLTALQEAIGALSGEARHELRALMLVGRGEHAAGEWEKALAAARSESRDANVGALTDEADLHHLLMKGLYELKLA